MKIKHEILVVDDMRDYREMLSLILQEKGICGSHCFLC